MPSQEVHSKITKLLLGKPGGQVHRFKDRPYRLLGRSQRALRHEALTNLALALQTGDPGAFLAGTLHDATDTIDSLLKSTEKGRGRQQSRHAIDKPVGGQHTDG